MPFLKADRFWRYGLATLLLTAAGCTQAPPPKKVVPRIVKVQKYDAATFVEHLAAAKLTLENDGAVSDIADDSKIIEAYSKQKNTKPALVNFALIEYTARGPGKVAAPISEAGGTSAVANIMAHLGASPYKIKEIRVQGAAVERGQPIKLTGLNAGDSLAVIDARHQALLENAHKLPVPQEARLQLKLLQFFTDSGNRDAAYLCADNLKRLLPLLPQDSENAQLYKDIETAEGVLRQKMPY